MVHVKEKLMAIFAAVSSLFAIDISLIVIHRKRNLIHTGCQPTIMIGVTAVDLMEKYVKKNIHNEAYECTTQMMIFILCVI